MEALPPSPAVQAAEKVQTTDSLAAEKVQTTDSLASSPASSAVSRIKVRHVLGCIAFAGIATLLAILLVVQHLAPSTSSSSHGATGDLAPGNNTNDESDQPSRGLLHFVAFSPLSPSVPQAPSSNVRPLVYLVSLGLLTLTVFATIIVIVFLRAVSHPCSVINWHGLIQQPLTTEDDRQPEVERGLPSPHHHSLRCVAALGCRAVRCLIRGQWPWSAAAVGLVHVTSGQPLPGAGWKWTAPFGELSQVNFFGRPAAELASSSPASPCSLYHVFAGFTPVVVLSSVKAVSAFYSAMKGPNGGHRVRDSRFSVLGSICDRLMGQSMGVKSGKEWDTIRKTFAPHFNPRAVSNSFDAVHQAVVEWLQREIHQGQLAQGLLDVHGSRLHLLPLQIIARLVYGTLSYSSMRALEGLCAEHSTLLGTLRHQSNRLHWVVLRFLKPSLCRRVLSFQHDWRVFNEQQVERLMQSPTDACILSHLLSETPSVEDFLRKAEWMDTIDEILLLNHDVTYIAMMAALTQLAMEPAVQEKLREELRQSRQQRLLTSNVEGADMDQISFSTAALADLRYLDAVVLESARCWPSIQFSFPERTAAACEVEGFLVPAHSVVVVDVESVNHDSAQWADPDRFDPERFLREPQLAQRFHRFGLSARQCLGQRFASLMVKLVVAHVVSKYQLRAHAPGVDSTSTSYSMNSSSWKMSMRDVKKDGLPYLTAYSCFPVLHCQPAGELALTSTPLSEPIFRTGLERVVSGSGIGVLGMSLGNSFFSRRTISLFIPFLLRFLPQLWIFIPDVPAECTYAAMGYSSREVKQKTRYNANRYRTWIKKTIDSLDPALRGHVRVIDWRNELSSHPVYQQRLAEYQRAYHDRQCPAFTTDVQDTTMAVLNNKVKPGVDMEQALRQGVDFLLMELAFLTTFHYTLTQPSSNQQLVYLYHRRWPVFERLLMHQYELEIRHDSTMGFVIVDHNHGGERSAGNSGEEGEGQV